MEPSSRSKQIYQVDTRVLANKPEFGPRKNSKNTVSRSCVEIPRRLYLACWCGIWCLHTCCALYLVKLAQLYWYLDHPYLSYYSNLIQFESDRHFKEAGVAFGVVGVAHIWCVLELIILSYGARELVFSSEDLSSEIDVLSSMKTMKAIRRKLSRTPKPPTKRLSHFTWLIDTANSWWSSCFGRRGLFGLESVFFDILFLVRQCVGIVLQSYQAKQTSEMISAVWLNRFFVILVVINCWMTPLVQRIFRSYPALGRLASITIDLGLTMGTNMVIPIIIFLPYLEAWDPEQYTFDMALLYDDLWFTNLVMENRLLFTRSLLDFVAKIVPHVSILMSLSCIKTLFVRARPNSQRILPSDRDDSASTVPTASLPALSKPFSTHFRLNGWKTLIIHALLVAWGCTLLGLHIFASLPASHTGLGGCKQSIRTWFSTKTTCTIYEYNCYRRNDIALVDALKSIEPSTLLNVIVAHCRDLVVPSEIRNFPNLIAFELFNVTLLEWPTSAAISPTIHTTLVTLMLVYVNMTALPDGVRGPLPESLSDIEIAYTNLTTLPDDLHESWHALDVLYFEHSLVAAFPKTLTQLAVDDLSLIGNQLETVDEVAEISVEMYTLALSQNPLRTLPLSVQNGTSFGFLSVEGTQLTGLPDWVNDSSVVQETAFASGTPVCSGVLDGWPRVDCTSGDPRGGGRYPLAVMLPRRVS